MAPHPRFVAVRAGDYGKNHIFGIRGVKIAAHFRRDMGFHPRAAGLAQGERSLAVGVGHAFIGMCVDLAKITAASNLHRMGFPGGVGLILTVNAVIQMQREVIIRQRLIVVFIVGDRQTHRGILTHLRFHRLCRIIIVFWRKDDFRFDVRRGFVHAAYQKRGAIRLLRFSTVRDIRCMVLPGSARQRCPVIIILHRPAKDSLYRGGNHRRQCAEMAHARQHGAMAVCPAPGESGPGFVVIDDRGIFIADFRRQFWPAERVAVCLNRFRHMAPHRGLRHVRAGKYGKNHRRFAGLRNAGNTRHQRRFDAGAVRLGHRDGCRTVGIRCATILGCRRR